MKHMTSRERVLAAFRGEEYDVMPVVSPTSLANLECMKYSKSYFPRANLNPERMANLAETSHSVLGFDSVMPYFGITNELGALGCEVDWGGADRMPTVKSGLLKNLDDFVLPSNYLSCKETSTVIGAIKLLQQRLNGDAVIIGKIIGPLSLLFHLYGVQRTMNSLILEREKVSAFLQVLSDICAEFALTQIEAGAEVITVSEDAAGALISKECYRQVAMPIEKRLNEKINSSAYIVFHISGDVMDRVDMFAQTGIHALNVSSQNDLPQLKKLVGDVKLIGGISAKRTLQNGKKQNVINEVRYAAENGMTMIAPDEAISLRVSNENLLEIRETALKLNTPFNRVQ